MASAGPNLPSSGASVTFNESVEWNNPGNITANDGTNATCSLTLGDASERLVATGFGFSIPSGATIEGVVAEWDRGFFGAGIGPCSDFEIRLVKDGDVAGDDKASEGAWSFNSMEDAEFGGEEDLWGTTLEPSDVNASNFGCSIACNVGESGGDGEARVDAVTLTVYYSGLEDEDLPFAGIHVQQNVINMRRRSRVQVY